jgi:hypothetical protein
MKLNRNGFLLGLRLGLAALFVFTGTLAVGQTLTVRAAFKSRYAPTEYPIDLLKFVLNKSGVPYTFTFADVGVMSQAREIALLKDNDRINIGWFGTSADLERDLVPIRFPIWRGLLGHRVFIINKDKQALFDQVNTLEDLKHFTGEQGLGWSDVAILNNAGLHQNESPYDTIFAKINAGRSDYFARGVTEAFREVETIGKNFPNLVVERHVLLVYPFAAFFFTNNQNPELAKAIEDGFRKAYADGSFLKFFYAHPTIKTVLAKANFTKRVRIDIPNPLLTPETLAIPQQFWDEK